MYFVKVKLEQIFPKVYCSKLQAIKLYSIEQCLENLTLH